MIGPLRLLTDQLFIGYVYSTLEAVYSTADRDGPGAGERRLTQAAGYLWPTGYAFRVASVIFHCEGCGDRLQPSDEVRAVYRELADVIGSEEVVTPRWAYTHVGHEPQGRAYRIIGRGRLADLERERQHPAQPE